MLLQQDADEQLDKLIEETTSPRLISTGEINSINELCLGSEGMVVCKFRPCTKYFKCCDHTVRFFLLFNMEFLKGICGIEKKIVRAHVFGSGKRQSSSVCGKCLSELKVKA